jgi:hypothetical protein
MMKTIMTLCCLVLATFAITEILQADESNNFVMRGTFNAGRGRSISANHTLISALGQTEPVGEQSAFWYFDLYPGLLTPVAVSIRMTPHLPVVEIPAEGGNFRFDVTITNNQPLNQTFDAWSYVVMPDGTLSGTLMGPISITLSYGAKTRERVQSIPSDAPAGWYTYNASVGIYPDIIIDACKFPFEKLGYGEGDGIEGWFCTGESFDEGIAESGFFSELPRDKDVSPGEFALGLNYPNPFNNSTTIGFSLPDAAQVVLSVHDANGRHVSKLVDGWRDAGVHEVTFDGSGLVSGVYFYRIETGDFSAVRKMVLMK